MLWRANLYIDEGPANDWNNIHPWNAPPSGGVTASTPKWWDASWGNNEWNRDSMNPDTYTAQGLANGANGLTTLPAGNGMQVIKFPTITPARTATTTVAGRVMYSWPQHDLEPRQNDTPGAHAQSGDSGSMDSPFDYKLKMIYEIGTMQDTINTQGKRFVKPKSVWPNPGAENDLARFADGAAGLAIYQQNVQNIVPANVDVAQWKTDPKITAFSTAPYQSISARSPGDLWWSYGYGADPGANNKTAVTKSFFPSLGLVLKYPAGTKAAAAGLTLATLKSKTWVVEAGTDCVGMAKRTVSYSDAGYTWGNLNPAWTEANNGAGSLNVWDVMTGERADKRSYPRFDGDETVEGKEPNQHSYEIFERTQALEFSEIVGLADQNQAQQSQLACVVPGDVYYNYYDLPGAGTIAGHIAVVAEVKYHEDGRVQDIWLFESTFGNDIPNETAQFVRNNAWLSLRYVKLEKNHYHIVRLKRGN